MDNEVEDLILNSLCRNQSLHRLSFVFRGERKEDVIKLLKFNPNLCNITMFSVPVDMSRTFEFAREDNQRKHIDICSMLLAWKVNSLLQDRGFETSVLGIILQLYMASQLFHWKKSQYCKLHSIGAVTRGKRLIL
jgi:hypothetical protein